MNNDSTRKNLNQYFSFHTDNRVMDTSARKNQFPILFYNAFTFVPDRY